MHTETREVWKHMKDFSFHILGRAIVDSTFSEQLKPYAYTLAIVNGAHGAEILLKSLIAREHPLLIFEKLPKSSKAQQSELSVADLFQHGHSHSYEDLPELLWATTGYKLSDYQKSLYSAFGDLRNQIVHFGPKKADGAFLTLQFLFETLDHIAINNYGESFVTYSEEWDDAIIVDGYLHEQVKGLKLHPKTKAFLKKSH